MEHDHVNSPESEGFRVEHQAAYQTATSPNIKAHEHLPRQEQPVDEAKGSRPVMTVDPTQLQEHLQGMEVLAGRGYVQIQAMTGLGVQSEVGLLSPKHVNESKHNTMSGTDKNGHHPAQLHDREPAIIPAKIPTSTQIQAVLRRSEQPLAQNTNNFRGMMGGNVHHHSQLQAMKGGNIPTHIYVDQTHSNGEHAAHLQRVEQRINNKGVLTTKSGNVPHQTQRQEARFQNITAQSLGPVTDKENISGSNQNYVTSSSTVTDLFKPEPLVTRQQHNQSQVKDPNITENNGQATPKAGNGSYTNVGQNNVSETSPRLNHLQSDDDQDQTTFFPDLVISANLNPITNDVSNAEQGHPNTNEWTDVDRFIFKGTEINLTSMFPNATEPIAQFNPVQSFHILPMSANARGIINPMGSMQGPFSTHGGLLSATQDDLWNNHTNEPNQFDVGLAIPPYGFPSLPPFSTPEEVHPVEENRASSPSAFGLHAGILHAPFSYEFPQNIDQMPLAVETESQALPYQEGPLSYGTEIPGLTTDDDTSDSNSDSSDSSEPTSRRKQRRRAVKIAKRKAYKEAAKKEKEAQAGLDTTMWNDRMGYSQQFFGNTDGAIEYMNRVTALPTLRPRKDPSIAKIEMKFEKCAQEVFFAIVNLSGIIDDENSHVIKYFKDGSEFCNYKHIEAISRIIVQEVIDRCKFGFRGSLMKDESKHASGVRLQDRTGTCKQRLANVVSALRVDKKICQDVLFDVSAIRLLTNAPLKYQMKKAVYKKSNKSRKDKLEELKQLEAQAGITVTGFNTEEKTPMTLSNGDSQSTMSDFSGENNGKIAYGSARAPAPTRGSRPSRKAAPRARAPKNAKQNVGGSPGSSRSKRKRGVFDYNDDTDEYTPQTSTRAKRGRKTL
ncbi:hypothetical protein GQ43DRAFT_468113 [Delitschia confertaspora ATCC 74209]|uniref:Uncharacterized protein n=1 Tax=Delitschia confertaspora ATCC 74209 TaxID=1513339 RepID=A0A9P4JTT0_9PLEO|nr:hypothetical protein GQ43DRAFT_468113 [Delitschia confertaspora ATCC 74209]